MNSIGGTVCDRAWQRPFASHFVYTGYGILDDVESVVETMDNAGAPIPGILRVEIVKAMDP